MNIIKPAILAAFLAVSLSACSGSQSGAGASAAGQAEGTEQTEVTGQAEGTEQTEGTGQAEGTEQTEGTGQTEASTQDRNILITYFSVPETDGVDTVGGASRVVVDSEVLGNNQYVAQLIQETLGGDLFRIETVQEYPGSHSPLLDFAHEEKAQNARPELASGIEDLDSYDVIFIGFPNWNADLPMPLYTFFEEHDFSGKTIVPFTVHGGSGFSRNIQIIAELEPDAELITNGLSISRDRVGNAQNDVVNWAQSLGL